MARAGRSIVIFIGYSLPVPGSPGDGQFVDAVDEPVVLERDVVEVGGEPQGGDAAVARVARRAPPR
jgi:hypothetical protein